jgi:hypothetical protein
MQHTTKYYIRIRHEKHRRGYFILHADHEYWNHYSECNRRRILIAHVKAMQNK